MPLSVKVEPALASCSGGVAGPAEAWVAIKILADRRTKDALVVMFADDDARRAVGTFFEHEFTPRMSR